MWHSEFVPQEPFRREPCYDRVDDDQRIPCEYLECIESVWPRKQRSRCNSEDKDSWPAVRYAASYINGCNSVIVEARCHVCSSGTSFTRQSDS